MTRSHLILDDIDEVDDSVLLLRVGEAEDVILVTAIGVVVRLDLQQEPPKTERIKSALYSKGFFIHV